MGPEGLEILSLIGAFADARDRPEAAAVLARALGGEELMLFAPDPELGVLLPAPGLRQTLSGAADWRTFLARCAEVGEHEGTLKGAGGREVRARGIAAAGDVVAVLLGGGPQPGALASLRPVLPLLGALFHGERRADSAEVRARSADEAVARAGVLTASLQQMRQRLQQALAEAESARAAADAANRAKSEFLANMSHELRTPINVVLGYGELLEMEIAGPITAGQRLHLQRIRSSSHHLLTLISDILDLAKVEAGQLAMDSQRESICEVVGEAVSLVHVQYTERGITLRNECLDREIPYVGDRDRVRQILLNLLSNAVKFSEPGASVTVRCAVTGDPAAQASLDGTELWTRIEVEDTGIGIAEAEQTLVFQPFKQVDGGHTRTQGGTGLGLTISRQLARLMGGDLTLRSEPGRGSCFSLWLPADAALAGTLDESIRVPEWYASR